MKLRSKFILFFTFLMAILIAGMIFYLNSYFKNYFKTNALDNFQILAELSESSYFGFIKALEIRIVDWTSDYYIQNTVEEILKTSGKDRESQVKALNGYLKNEKIIYDPDALIIDILDKDGLVLASSRDDRLGVDEKKEELEGGRIRFTEAIQGDFGQTFATSVVAEEDEHSDPMIHITTRIFSKKTYSDDSFVPLDAVMLVHFANTGRLRDVLIGNIQQEEERVTGKALTEHYKTADIYLVNKDGLMITPSRLGQETVLKQKVETEPVKACLERGEEIKGEYLDYRGQPVFGASMCLEGTITLVLEAESQEVLAPLKNISRFLVFIGGITVILMLIGVILLSHWLLRGLKMITSVAEKVSNNNFKERIRLNSKDEIGYLAKVFNRMLDSLEGYYKSIDEKEKELKKETSFVRLLQKVSMSASETVNIDALVIKTIEEVCRFSGWVVGHYYIFDDDSGLLKPSELWYFNEPAKYESFKKAIMNVDFKIGEGFVGRAYKSKLPAFIKDITKDEVLAKSGIGELAKVKSALAFPLIVNSRVVMILDFYNDETAEMTDELLKVLNNVAIQLGRAIEKNKVENELKKNITKGELTKIALYNILEDMKESEDNLKKEHHRMTAITSSMGEGLMVVDKGFKIILINTVAQELLGVAGKNILNEDIRAIVKIYKGDHEVSDDDSPISVVMKEWKTVIIGPQDNYYFKINSGSKFPVTIVGAPLKDGIVGSVVIFKDITAEKTIDEARVSFVSTSSHQLRTPLTSMKWFSEMLIGGDAGPLNKEQKDIAQNIYLSIERMISIVNLLLQIARVEAGRLRVETAPVDLKAVVEDSIKVFSSALESNGQKIEIKTSPKNLPIIPMDKDIIDQVMQNLLSNAIRYTPANKTITVSISVKGKEILFSIEDQGVGIPESQNSRIFEKFFRANNASKLVPEGSGLGLSLVKLLVNGWGGKIWFESKENDGTTFFFTIPLEGMKAKEGEVKLTV